MSTVRDRMWMWGHEAGSHDTGYNIGQTSRMTPAEAAFYMDIPNMIMVRYRDKPEIPFDQHAIAFRPLKEVFWSVVGAGGRSSQEELNHVLELSKRFPNITGIFLDDFFRTPGTEGNQGVMSVAEIQALRDRLVVDGKRLELGVTLYTHQLDMALGPYLDLCDWVSLWTWNAPDLKDIEANFAKCEQLSPNSKKMLGLYLWDYGLKQPMPLDLMKMQSETALRWLREGRIDGMIFLASCICDLELDTVKWSRDWIRKVGDEQLN
jgi:hypothetical protein